MTDTSESKSKSEIGNLTKIIARSDLAIPAIIYSICKNDDKRKLIIEESLIKAISDLAFADITTIDGIAGAADALKDESKIECKSTKKNNSNYQVYIFYEDLIENAVRHKLHELYLDKSNKEKLTKTKK